MIALPSHSSTHYTLHFNMFQTRLSQYRAFHVFQKCPCPIHSLADGPQTGRWAADWPMGHSMDHSEGHLSSTRPRRAVPSTTRSRSSTSSWVPKLRCATFASHRSRWRRGVRRPREAGRSFPHNRLKKKKKKKKKSLRIRNPATVRSGLDLRDIWRLPVKVSSTK